MKCNKHYFPVIFAVAENGTTVETLNIKNLTFGTKENTFLNGMCFPPFLLCGKIGNEKQSLNTKFCTVTKLCSHCLSFYNVRGVSIIIYCVLTIKH